jgi:hypothetical protein
MPEVPTRFVIHCYGRGYRPALTKDYFLLPFFTAFGRFPWNDGNDKRQQIMMKRQQIAGVAASGSDRVEPRPFKL